MPMRRSALITCALGISVLVLGCADKQTPPLKSKEVTALSDDQQMKEGGNDFLDGELTIVKRVSDIPENCRYGFAGADVNNQLYMADPGTKFEATDVIEDPKAPRTRLLFAGSSSKSCFIYFEKGGRDLNQHLEIFSLGPPVTLTYHGVDSKGPYRDVAALRMAVRGFAFMRMTGSERFERR
jgi:hypothetical protein